MHCSIKIILDFRHVRDKTKDLLLGLVLIIFKRDAHCLSGSFVSLKITFCVLVDLILGHVGHLLWAHVHWCSAGRHVHTGHVTTRDGCLISLECGDLSICSMSIPFEQESGGLWLTSLACSFKCSNLVSWKWSLSRLGLSDMCFKCGNIGICQGISVTIYLARTVIHLPVMPSALRPEISSAESALFSLAELAMWASRAVISAST